MRTISTSAFDGQVTFKTKYQTLETALRIEELQRQLEGKSHTLLEQFPTLCNLVVILLVRTEDIVFDLPEDAHPLLLDWQDFWAKWQKKHDITDALQWRLETDGEVIDAWINAVAASNFRNPATLPPERLTKEERDALEADPENPLD